MEYLIVDSPSAWLSAAPSALISFLQFVCNGMSVAAPAASTPGMDRISDSVSSKKDRLCSRVA